MQKDIIKKIDLLVEMSDTNNTFSALEEELKILELDIKKQKDALKELTKSMVDTKYMKASDRIIDENIKISLENKIANYKKQLVLIKKKIEDISEEEEGSHQRILEIEEEKKTAKRFLDSLELKLKTVGSKDRSVFSFYETLIDNTAKEIEQNEKKLQKKKEEQEIIQKKLQDYGEVRVKLEDKIQKDSEKLEETKTNLLNPKSYMDESERKKDEELVTNYNKAIESLEKRKLEILNDPAYLGYEATKLLMEDDRTSALSKVHALVQVVKERPYMEVRFEELEELEENKIQKRDEFASLLEGKQYDKSNDELLEKRVSYLKMELERKQNECNILEKQIEEMDTTLVKILMDCIKDAKEKREKLKEEIEVYKKVIEENNEYKTPKKKASLTSAFHRKLEELEQVNKIVTSYEKELENTIRTSKKLEEEDYTKKKEEILKIEEELKEIEKGQLLNNYPVDILAMEKDKSELKKLTDDVEKIAHRKKYQKMPKELADEIELSLSSFEEEIKEPIKTETFINNYRIEEMEEVKNEEETLNILEDVIEEEKDPIIKTTPLEPISSIETIPFIEEEQKEEVSFPPRKRVVEETKENLLKVIKIESLEEEQNIEEKEEEEFMINEFEDTNYISFNDLLEGEEEHAN